MKASELVERYIALRDRKAAFKAEYDKKVAVLEDAMGKIEAVLLRSFNESGIENIKTEAGTAYVSVRTSATVADRDVYFGWVGEDFAERAIFLDARANKTAVDQFRAANNDLPPGLNWREERVVNIRRT